MTTISFRPTPWWSSCTRQTKRNCERGKRRWKRNVKCTVQRKPNWRRNDSEDRRRRKSEYLKCWDKQKSARNHIKVTLKHFHSIHLLRTNIFLFILLHCFVFKMEKVFMIRFHHFPPWLSSLWRRTEQRRGGGSPKWLIKVGDHVFIYLRSLFSQCELSTCSSPSFNIME